MICDPMIHWKLTERGFAIGEFRDRYDARCTIQKSSLAFEDCIWLGPAEIEYDPAAVGPHCTRMHLTRAMVAELIPVLQYFANTGSLPEPGTAIPPRQQAELRVENIKISEELNAALLAAGIEMPLSAELAHPTEIYDRTGRTVLAVQGAEQATAYQIASLIVMAVNTCGSFKAKIITQEPEANR